MNSYKYVLIPVIVGLIAFGIKYLIFALKNKKDYSQEQFPNQAPQNTTMYYPVTEAQASITINWYTSYQPKYLLTVNEKQQFRKLKVWATAHDAIVFTKVRVLDLIEPRKGVQNYKTLFYKIQAKHVDFVICDADIRVKCIIELDDSSHNDQKREERDNFLREALSGAGYKVLHTRYITPEFLNQI